MTTVTVQGVAKSYPGRPPVAALHGVDLTVKSRSLVAVLGPSGCGKTTLLRLIAGFDRPDAGTIAIDDTVVSTRESAVPPERRHVGIVPQEGALFPHLDVAGNVAFGLRRMPRAAVRTRVGEMLELVGLAGFERRRPHELSGGQQQRIALARALAPRPGVVLLDEPFTALDTSLRASLRADVVATLSAAGATAILVTHDQTEALMMADTVAVMRNGEIVQHGPPNMIYRHPVDLDVGMFVGDAVILPGVARGDCVTCPLGTLPVDGAVELQGPVTVLLRPEQITRSDEGALRGTVVAVRYHGHDALVDLQVGDHRVLARWASVALPMTGDAVGLDVTGAAHAFPAG